jgi:colanic acid/amylovoran biosynthesis glycosyltransferase
MNKKKVLFLTSNFPFYPGEQFIEEEIKFWSIKDDVEIFIAPASAQGLARVLPKTINVDLSLVEKSRFKKIWCLFIVPFQLIFWHEFFYILKNKGFNWKSIFISIKSIAVLLFVFRKLSVLLKNKNIDIIYSYWNDTSSYAAILAKRKGLVNKVVTRAHRYDVYEEERDNNYMPLKRQFINDFDKIFAISREGVEYIKGKYNVSNNSLLLSYLGVSISKYSSKKSKKKELKIISIAFCNEVKRIDKIINAIGFYKRNNPDLDVSWSHIGSGTLFENLISLAKKNLEPLGVNFFFLGEMSNSEVHVFFEENEIDILINTSKSEGIPVSIMEAMSYGVPVIAPNVGGIAEIVTDECGVLMSDNPDIEEIASAIYLLQEKAKDDQYRLSVKKKIETTFNSSENYKNFINSVMQKL